MVLQNIEIDESLSDLFKKMEISLKDGKALVPIKKGWGVDFKTRFASGEPKDIDEDEVINYIISDGMVSQLILNNAKMIVAYGYDFDMSYPNEIDENDKRILDLFKIWSEFVNLDMIIMYIYVCGIIFGNFYAEKVYDKRGGKLSTNSWGIKSIKILDPRTIKAERSEDGRYIKYYQHPKAGLVTPRTLKNSPKTVILDPAQIIHIKFDDYINKTYGISRAYSLLDLIDMKRGVIIDAINIAQRRGSPFIVWKIGSEDKIMPLELFKAYAQNISNQMIDLTENDLVVPAIVNFDIVSGSDNAVDFIPLINMINKEIAIALGIPDIFFSEGEKSTGGSEVKQELWIRSIKSFQNFIGNELRKKLFIDLVYPPIKFPNGRIKSAIDDLSPIDFFSVPKITWKVIESVSDHRLRLREFAQFGILSEEEIRKEINKRGKISDEDYPATIKVKMRELDLKEQELKLKEKEMKRMEKMGFNPMANNPNQPQTQPNNKGDNQQNK